MNEPKVSDSELRLRGFLGKDAGLLDNVIAAHRSAVLDELQVELDRLEAEKYPSPVIKDAWVPFREIRRWISERRT